MEDFFKIFNNAIKSNEYPKDFDMERALVKEIIKYGTDLTIIEELSEDTTEELEKELLNIINSNTNNLDNEKIELMIDIFIKDCHEQIYAINYIDKITINVKSYLSEKLKEPFYEYEYEYENDNEKLTDKEWSEIWEVESEYLPLNQFTLCDAIELEYTDMVDVYSAQSERVQDKLLKLPSIDITPMVDLFKPTINKTRTKRELNLALYLFDIILLSGYRQGFQCSIKKKFNIKNNTPEKNQEILDNSYNYIIEVTNAHKESIIYDDKGKNDKLFTYAKREVQLRNKNHFMDFLYKCNTGILDNGNLIFIEFVEAYIRGYKQYEELISLTTEEKKKKLKEYKRDLEALKKYNILNENLKNIKELTKEIKFLENPNKHHEMIIFKELSNQLEITTQQIANYITTVKRTETEGTNSKRTILNNFDKFNTKSTDIKINMF